LRIGAGNAGDHGVALVHGQQGRAKDVAVLIDHALDVALHIATAVETFVQHAHHVGDQRAVAAVVHFEAVGIAHAQFLELFPDAIIAPDQNRRAIATVLELDCRAQHDILLGFGKNDPLGRQAAGLIGLGQYRRRRVEAGLQALAIGIQILDRLLGNAAIHGRLGNRSRNHVHQPRIKRGGNDIVDTKARRVAAIGHGDFFGYLFASQFGNRMGGSNLHFLVDPGGPHVQRAAEDEGKAENIVDLVGIVGASGGNDRIGPRRLGVGRGDFRIGVGHRKNDRFRGHVLDHFRL